MNELTFEAVKTIVSEVLISRNYSPSSIQSLTRILKRFNDYLESRKIPDYRGVKESDLYGFMEYLEKSSKRGIKKETTQDYALAMKRVFQILEREDKILQNPFGDIEMKGKRHNIRDKVLSEKEMRDFIDAVPVENPGVHPLDFRNRTILELLYGTGIRARELCNLEVTDVFIEEKMIFIRNGKGKKDRVLPLGETAVRYLSEYIRKIRPKKAIQPIRKYRTGKLFLGNFGKSLSTGGLSGIIRKIKDAQGFAKTICPHIIRHSFATHLLNAGADIREVQLLLGHTSLDSTQIYLNLSTAYLKEIYRKYHPLENELYFDVLSRESYVFEWKLVDKKSQDL